MKRITYTSGVVIPIHFAFQNLLVGTEFGVQIRKSSLTVDTAKTQAYKEVREYAITVWFFVQVVVKAGIRCFLV